MATRQAPITLTEATRRDWAATWSARLSAMLDAPAKKNTVGRVFRMRFYQDGDYLVATLVQPLIAPQGVPSDQAVKIMLFLTLPYTRANLGGSSVVSMQLSGQYSVDEIVAFMRLDVLDPDSASWKDETRYSEIITVSNILQQHGKN